MLLKMVPDSNAIDLLGATDASEPNHDSGRTMGEDGLVVHVDGRLGLRRRWGVLSMGPSSDIDQPMVVRRLQTDPPTD